MKVLHFVSIYIVCVYRVKLGRVKADLIENLVPLSGVAGEVSSAGIFCLVSLGITTFCYLKFQKITFYKSTT